MEKEKLTAYVSGLNIKHHLGSSSKVQRIGYKGAGKNRRSKAEYYEAIIIVVLELMSQQWVLSYWRNIFD